MRSHMGRGQISERLGDKVRPAISSMKQTSQNIATSTSIPANGKGSGYVNKSSQSGNVSAGGSVQREIQQCVEC